MLALNFKLKLFWSCGILSSLLLVSCQSAHNKKTLSSTDSTSRIQDTLSYKNTSIKEISPYFTENNGEIDTTYIKVSFPEFEDSSMNKLILQNILFEGEQGFKQYTNNFLEGYGNFVEENNIHYPIAWKKETEISIDLYTPNLICIKNFTYEFSGGAHGNSFKIWNIYDLENNRKLDLNTFVSENKKKDFIKIVEKFFRKHEGISDSTNLEKDYFFENGIFALSATFGLTKDGIMFHYNPYEIKPYAQGTTTLIIGYDDIQDFLTNTGKNYINNIKEYYHSIS